MNKEPVSRSERSSARRRVVIMTVLMMHTVSVFASVSVLMTSLGTQSRFPCGAEEMIQRHSRTSICHLDNDEMMRRVVSAGGSWKQNNGKLKRDGVSQSDSE